MKLFHLILLLSSSLCLLLSCEKSIDESDPEATEMAPQASALLQVITRDPEEESNDNKVLQGHIYIFNNSGSCIDMLTTSETSNEATAQLPAGSYSLYAVGGEDLSRFNLPTKQTATTSSVITRAEGKAMDNLMLKKADVTLEDGESLRQTIYLDHVVLNIKQIDIKDVPDDVTKVELSVTPLYSSVKLDGTYPDDPTESYKIVLTKAETGSTWSASPNQFLFPSKGTPTIKVSFTTASGTKSYSYTASESFPANHHFTLTGTYTADQGVSLTGVLLASDWGEDITITFGFDESNSDPKAGARYNGYYVVSVNESARTALLRATSNVTYTAPGANWEAATSSQWLSALTTALASYPKPSNAVGDWRIPTFAEASVFLSDASLYSGSSTPTYFCLNDNVLNWCYASGLPTTEAPTSTPNVSAGPNFDNTTFLRPVITISY